MLTETNPLESLTAIIKLILEDGRAQRTALHAENATLREALIRQNDRHEAKLVELTEGIRERDARILALEEQNQMIEAALDFAAAPKKKTLRKKSVVPVVASTEAEAATPEQVSSNGRRRDPCPQAPAGRVSHVWKYPPGGYIGECKFCHTVRDDTPPEARK